MDNAIKEFLSERKTDRIKKKSSLNLTPEELLAITQEAEQEFSLACWLPQAAKRACQLSLVTHPSKFSHPGSKTTAIIAEGKRATDGFLRTGNASAQLDVFGNAAAMDVFKFLSLILNDGMSILEHLQLNSEKIQNELTVPSVSFDELKEGFLSIKKTDTTAVTSERVKQVYFPVADNHYHLLSVLTPSGLVFELRYRIQNTRFSDQIKEAREDKRKNAHNLVGFDDLYGLSMIGYGGTKPQNISVLNSTYRGKAYLLPSIPPLLTQRNQRLPNKNFFTDCLRLKDVNDNLIAIHKLLKTDYDNKNIRDGYVRRIQSVIDVIVDRMWSVRLQAEGWSLEKNYVQLPSHQKIWLDEVCKDERQKEDDWLQEIMMECARWIIKSYKKLLGTQAILLGDVELAHIKKIVEHNKEHFQ